MSDRLLPFGALSPAGIQPNGATAAIATELDAVLGFIDNTEATIESDDNPSISAVTPVATPLGA
jgi:hypothetical protein